MALLKSLAIAAVVLAAFCAVARAEEADAETTPAIPATNGVRKFTCVFFPGIGNDWPELDVEPAKRPSHPKYLRHEFDDFWGPKLRNRLRDKCEDLIMYDTDTSYRAWDDPSIAKEFDEVLKRQKPHIVFAHGYSNLVLANCKHMKLHSCLNLGSKIEWFGIAAPLRGTEAAHVMPKLCPKLMQKPKFKEGSDCVEEPVQTHPPTFDVSNAWKSLLPAKVPKWVYKIGENDMSGSMCGLWATDYTAAAAQADNTSFGLIAKALSQYKPKDLNSRNERYRPDPTDWQARNMISQAKVPKTGNDGVVALSSCAIRAMSKYKKLPTAKYYALGGNHDFSTGSQGDNYNSGASEPIAWMVNMVDRVRKANKYPHRFSQMHEEEETEGEAEVESEADAELQAESEAYDQEMEAEEQAEEEEDAAEEAAEAADEAQDEAAEDAEMELEDTDAAVEQALHGDQEEEGVVIVEHLEDQ